MVAGHSAGGHLPTTLTLPAEERGGPVFGGQLPVYPIAGAAFDTGPSHQVGLGAVPAAVRFLITAQTISAEE
jgi:acetyl esterase/lipase